MGRHLAEAYALLQLCAQADVVRHAREAYLQHLKALEAVERLDLAARVKG